MKMLIAVILASAGNFAADVPQVFSFTNKEHVVFKDVQTVKVRREDVLFRMPSGLGQVKLNDLPPELAAQFGYDPGAVQKEKEEKELKAAQAAPLEAARQRAVQERAQLLMMRKNAFDSRMVIDGKILQKLDEGLLLKSGVESLKGFGSGGKSRSYRQNVPVYDEFCLLTDYGKGKSLVDGDHISVLAYPNGEYSYTATSGGKKTIRKFTANLDRVTQLTDKDATAAAQEFRDR